MAKPRIAVIIPTLDEEKALHESLPPLVGSADELIVVDGGSSDQTVAVAEHYGARVVVGPRGRGTQLNAGVEATTAEILLFLHADTYLPDGTAIDNVRATIQGGYDGGGFEIRFDSDRLVYRFGSAMVTLRTRLTKTPLGDQAQFATRKAFEAIGGFSDWPILEDLDFIQRLRRHGKLAILKPILRTSARRFERYGPVKTLANNWLIFTLFTIGVSPEALQRFYPRHRG